MSDSEEESADGVRFVYKHLIASIASTLLGILLILMLETVLKDAKTDSHVLYSILEHAATALTVAGLWHILNELVIKRDFFSMGQKLVNRFIQISQHNHSETLQYIGNARKDAKLGLIDTFHDVVAFSYSEFILHPTELKVVLGEGSSWISMHLEALRDRIQDERKKTTIFIVHPESIAVELVAEKLMMTPQEYRERIFRTIQILQREMVPNANLKVLGHKSVPHHSIYLGDRLAVTPYYFSHIKRNPPVFVFEKGSYVAKVQSDLIELEKESSVLLDQNTAYVE